MGNWSHIENSERGFANELSRYVYGLEESAKFFLPDLRQGKNLYLFSDYSSSKNQNLISYSLLIIDEVSFQSFIDSQKLFWEKYFPDARIIDYKGLNDKIKGRALIPFLHLCNDLNGLLFTILFPKNIKSIYSNEPPEYLQNKINVWGNKIVQEKFLRLREIVLAILNGLAKKSQNIFWVTDNDDIVANDIQIATANVILKGTLIKYLDFDISEFEFRTLGMDYADRCLEKLCSLADLAAGTLVDFLGDYHIENINPRPGEIANPIPHPKLKINPITNWLSKNEGTNLLKKINLKITETDKNNLKLEGYRFPEFFSNGTIQH